MCYINLSFIGKQNNRFKLRKRGLGVDSELIECEGGNFFFID